MQDVPCVVISPEYGGLRVHDEVTLYGEGKGIFQM